MSVYIEDGIRGWEVYGLPVTSGDVEDVRPAELKGLLTQKGFKKVYNVLGRMSAWQRSGLATPQKE